MEAIISNLLSRFEKGVLSRRGLIQGLTMLAAASGAAQAQTPQAGIKAAKIDHMSIQVSDLPRSIAFYQKMFGLTIVSEDKPNEIVRLGIGMKALVSPSQKSYRCGGSLCDRGRELQQRGGDTGVEDARGNSGR
jgi:hypothetical protein